MEKLKYDRPPFIRVPEGLAAEAQKIFRCPVRPSGDGDVCMLTAKPCKIVAARPFDTFESIAGREAADVAHLRELNGGEVYAGRQIYIPR